MQYYVIPATGAGIIDSPMEPSVSMSSWVGIYFSASNDFLVATNDVLSGYTPLTTSELQTECINRGLDYNQVLTWSAS